MDIRVAGHVAPLDELARLLEDATAYGTYGGAIEALMEGRPEDSLSLLDEALRVLPGEANFVFLAGALAAAGRGDEAEGDAPGTSLCQSIVGDSGAKLSPPRD